MGEVQRARIDKGPFKVEVCPIFDDSEAALRHAVACGCTPVAAPEYQPPRADIELRARSVRQPHRDGVTA